MCASPGPRAGGVTWVIDGKLFLYGGVAGIMLYIFTYKICANPTTANEFAAIPEFSEVWGYDTSLKQWNNLHSGPLGPIVTMPISYYASNSRLFYIFSGRNSSNFCSFFT